MFLELQNLSEPCRTLQNPQNFQSNASSTVEIMAAMTTRLSEAVRDGLSGVSYRLNDRMTTRGMDAAPLSLVRSAVEMRPVTCSSRSTQRAWLRAQGSSFLLV